MPTLLFGGQKFGRGIITPIMNRYNFQITLKPEPEGGFTVTVPSLPGCVSWGKDLKEARAMAKDAIEGYVASLIKHGEPVPEDKDTLLSSVELEYAQTA